MKKNVNDRWLLVFIAFLLGIFLGIVFGAYMANKYWLETINWALINCN